MTSYYRKISETALAVLDTTNFKNEAVIVNRINVPRNWRGKGIRSSLLREVCADADAKGIVLFLGISPSDGLGYDELYQWYQRYGFRGDPIRLLRREPQEGKETFR